MIKELFDKAVEMDEGKSILIPVHDKGQQDSLRVALSRQRKVYLESKPPLDIIVSNVTNQSGFFVRLTKVKRITEYVIMSENGETEYHSLDDLESPMIPPPTASNSDDRIRKLMKEDGYSDEDIEAHLKGV